MMVLVEPADGMRCHNRNGCSGLVATNGTVGSGQKPQSRHDIDHFGPNPPSVCAIKPVPTAVVSNSEPDGLRGPPARSRLLPRRQGMAKGTVKWFNPTKGYGFIQPSAGGKDVFVHVSAVERAGLSSLNEGQKVEYELVSNRGKTSAENLKVM